MKGVVCVNKPIGWTSFDVVARLRRILKNKKIGHSGTLDPIATGVLPVFIGKATKAISFLQNTQKAYIAGFELGKQTDTLDCSGQLIYKKKSTVRIEQVQSALKRFSGLISQVPPKFSALKIKGTPAYRLARAGKNFELNPRQVEVYEIKCVKFDSETQSGEFFVHCSSGTYIRAICRDLGDYLNTGCVLKSLVRTMACGWNLADCFTLEEIESLSASGNFEKFIIALDCVFNNLVKLKLSSSDRIRFLNGASIKLPNRVSKENVEFVAVYFKDEFLGLAQLKEDELIVEKLFV